VCGCGGVLFLVVGGGGGGGVVAELVSLSSSP